MRAICGTKIETRCHVIKMLRRLGGKREGYRVCGTGRSGWKQTRDRGVRPKNPNNNRGLISINGNESVVTHFSTLSLLSLSIAILCNYCV